MTLVFQSVQFIAALNAIACTKATIPAPCLSILSQSPSTHLRGMKPSILRDDCNRVILNASQFLHNRSLRRWYGVDKVSSSVSSSSLHNMHAAESSSAMSPTSSLSLELIGVYQHEGKLATDALLLLETSITLKADFPFLLPPPKYILFTEKVKCRQLN